MGLKKPGRNSGKSKSIQNFNGIRRTDNIAGELLAPRSIRRTWKKKGKALLSKCSNEDLKRANITLDQKEKDNG